MKKNNIILVGFMASGKSTIGQELGKQLHMDFVDTDTMIEAHYGMPISDMFVTKGEAYFRKCEQDLIAQFLNELDHAVISTGGGLPIYHDNMDKLGILGTTFYLRVGTTLLYQRLVKDTHRPILHNHSHADLRILIKNMLNDRIPIYKKSDHTIAAYRSISEICKRITQLYKMK